jgi:formylglycine-generating enzyme required for sulfatase activity
MLEVRSSFRVAASVALALFGIVPALAGAAQQRHAAAGRMVRLPGGTFKMGSRGDNVTVQPFLLDVTAVTLAAYESCVKAGKCTAPGNGGYCNGGKADRVNHPVNCVDWNQATAYCEWAKKRLPTGEEQEWAARGAERGTAYPWGNEEPSNQLCWSGAGSDRNARGFEGTCAVGSYPRGDSPQGLKDLAGNVWEWSSSTQGGVRMTRGGGWAGGNPELVSAAARYGLDPAFRGDFLGFRCAKNP